ncbi:hypothetical protein [Vitiosangium sp. GDMCC 1.1324]|uniref:hypothetical protein n=1 Tax=Vitiosangium sp. (strain GDMCC 1.1324) TaxID=2138576 RepID=UPI000D3532EA|nr:hypothetical protein [Vitiosangium sp. GDMCC 1.1324]PTL81127.1 hypothetical protein DAT35_23660 [Vitiosangium sp. GDMCC 1.1324]
MTNRRLTQVLMVGIGALATGCLQLPTPEERLCQRYCYGQIQAVPTQGATTCRSSDNYYWDHCVHTCTQDIAAITESCRSQLEQAYGCGADHSWFCVPSEDGGHTLTQFDTCRDTWNAVYACEKSTPDAGSP